MPHASYSHPAAVADGNPVGDPVTVTTDEDGAFETSVTVPEDAAAGEHTVVGSTEDGLEAEAPVTVYTPTVDAGGPVDPGGEVPVTGGGFPPNTEIEVVVVDGDANPVGDPVTVVTDGDGGFSAGVPIPTDAEPGDHTVVVTTPNGTVFSDGVRIGTGAGAGNGDRDISIDVVHEVRYRGQMQTTYGYGFLPGEVVTGTQQSEPLALGTQVADENGTVRFDWTIRADETLGEHEVVLVGEVSGEVSGTFEVIEDPALAATGAVVWPTLAIGSLVLGLGAYLVTRRRRETA